MAIVTPTKSVRNRCVIEVFGGVFFCVLSRCFLDFSVGVGAFVIGLGHISSFCLKKCHNFNFVKWIQKQQLFFPNTSRLLQCSSACRFIKAPRSEKKCVKGWSAIDLPYLCPLWSTHGREKNNSSCKGPRVLHPFQIYLKSIKRVWKGWNGNCWQTADRRTCSMITHLAFGPCAKKDKILFC